MSYSTMSSPIGEITIVERDGALAGLYLTGHRPAPNPETFGDRVEHALPAAEDQLVEYFAGTRTTFDLQLGAHGTAFQEKVWTALRAIPYGQTWTYGQLAEAIGQPGAARAVGLANGRNPISIVVPCHRVVGSSGKLTGYAGGTERKAFLLALEGGGFVV